MQIGKDYQINSDSLNVIVSKRRTRVRKATGEKYKDWENVGYFSTLTHALDFLVEQKVRDSGLKDLETVVGAIKDLEEKIETALSASTSHTEAIKTSG